MNDKIIVSNRGALTAKYGSAGVSKIEKAIKALIAADAKRGIKSRLVYLDKAAAMKSFRGRAVNAPSSARQNKEAIDAIFRTVNPEYLMILGAPDVVPHQDMTNPMFDPPDDPDRYAYGDVPYACDVSYSRDIATFKGPTRVVGRLPDLTGAREPSHLLALLRVAEKYRPHNATDYGKCFGLSTQSWRKSTEESLFNVFGDSAALTLSPPNGQNHPASRLAPLAHFINCHGGLSDPNFYGERGNSKPISLSSDAIKGKVKAGTVAAVECCYGAELYDSVALSSPLPICQRYLIQGAYGYFGGTTIAYGPAEGNGAADLITQYGYTRGSIAWACGAACTTTIRSADCRARSDRFEDPWTVQPARRSFGPSGDDHESDGRPQGGRSPPSEPAGAVCASRKDARGR
jgi:hypothetical protein